MKKVVSIIVASIMVLAASMTLIGCVPREQKLKVYTWGLYMDDSLEKKFEKEYSAVIGKKFDVEIVTFETNEEMYTKLVADKSDYDLVCPSDYMAEKLIKNDLLQKMDTSKMPNWSKIDSLFKKGGINAYDPENEYFVPYMYGSLGILYDNTQFTQNDVKSWDALYTSNVVGKKIVMKDSIRDAFAATNIYNNSAELKAIIADKGYNSDEYKELLQELVNPTEFTTALIASAEATLNAQSSKVKKYAGDSAVQDAINDAAGVLNLFWSCDAGYVMCENSNYSYYVPEEGSNIWVDGFCIPKNAVNVDAAHAFLDFLMRPENAALNMAEAGACTPVTEGAEIFKQDVKQEDFYKEASAQWQQMYIDTLFVSGMNNVRDRLAVFTDIKTAAQESALNTMWTKITSR